MSHTPAETVPKIESKATSKKRSNAFFIVVADVTESENKKKHIEVVTSESFGMSASVFECFWVAYL